MKGRSNSSLNSGSVTEPSLIRTLVSSAESFDQQFKDLLHYDATTDPVIEARVRDIIASVRSDGDTSLLAFTQELDHWQPECGQDLCISSDQIDIAEREITVQQRQALTTAAQRIRDFHERQKQDSWTEQGSDGTTLGQKISPLSSVGIYVPGGKASYPSTVLMNAIPAQVAGVERICMVVPTSAGVLNPLVLAAAKIAGVTEVYRVGGAQAIAALAYGTETITAVDKIVGPGNAYVATAKKQVFGQVGMDMIAGPSEVLIICDGATPPDWIALDLFAQAEHDEMAQAILLSPDAGFLEAVADSVERLLPTMDRAEVIRTSLSQRGALVLVADLAEAIALSNRIAPEHLELSVADAESYLPNIRHAGAIFLGRFTPEAFGDYCAGPNHVLPTSGTARFASPLGVYDFQKRTSIIQCTESSAKILAATASVLARGEGLQAHALSAEVRGGK